MDSEAFTYGLVSGPLPPELTNVLRSLPKIPTVGIVLRFEGERALNALIYGKDREKRM